MAAPVLNRSELERGAVGGADGSLVQQIFATVVRQIRACEWAPGSRLPSVRQLASDCQVSRDTAARAYDALVAQGHVESRRGSGYFVKAGGSDHWTLSRAVAGRAGASRSAAAPPRQWLLSADLEGQPASGALPLAWQNDSALTAALRSVVRARARSLMGHVDARGYLPLRRQLCVMLDERGIQVDPQQLLVTAGAAEALHLVILANTRAGSHVLVENPGPPIMIERLMAAGQDFLPVPRRADGPDVDVMRSLCEKHRPKHFFCSSILHNPTSGNTSPHKAFQVLKLAEEFDFTVVEDDSYSDLLPPLGSAHVARLATLDQLRRVIYIGSLSKTLGAGLRTGFIAASAEQIEWLLMWRVATTIAGANLTERTAYALLSQGNYRHHCEQLRARLDETRGAVASQLKRLGVTTADPVTPTSGMYLWTDLGLGVDAEALAVQLKHQGHTLAPGRLFSVSGACPSFMRFNVATSHNHAALPALARLLKR